MTQFAAYKFKLVILLLVINRIILFLSAAWHFKNIEKLFKDFSHQSGKCQKKNTTPDVSCISYFGEFDYITIYYLVIFHITYPMDLTLYEYCREKTCFDLFMAYQLVLEFAGMHM